MFDGASGIGKTFGALRLASDMPDNLPESASPIRDYQLDVAYVGFNCHAPITDTEEVALRACASDDEAKTDAMRGRSLAQHRSTALHVESLAQHQHGCRWCCARDSTFRPAATQQDQESSSTSSLRAP